MELGMGTGGQSYHLYRVSDHLGDLQFQRVRMMGCGKFYLEEMTCCGRLDVAGTVDKCVNTWLSE